jgi:TonB-dependent starch-binding outer membrane protein SusC
MVKRIARLSILLFMVMGLTAYGQTGRINGTVVDAATGETLPGASVMVRGTTTGSITDFDGRFEFSAPAGEHTIIASFVGYLQSTRQITLAAGETVTINFELASDVQLLEEFVVIGYGIQRKEDATGSINVVDSRDFNRGNITTPSELLAGKIPGLQITSTGGAPGAGAQIRIRGGSSLAASNNPLIVIDGVPVDGDGISGMRDPLSLVNPNDIASFTVLKDASATAIYGSRASNGVIIITTKSGEGVRDQGVTGLPVLFNYTGTFSMATLAQTQEVLGADQFRELIQQRHPLRVDLLGGTNTNWQDQIYRNAVGHDHNFSAAGRAFDIPYRVSLGYSAQDGILDRDNLTRTSAAFNVSPSFFDNSLKININARAVRAENQFANQGAIGAAVQFDPTQPILDPNSPFGGYFEWAGEDGPRPVATKNPVALIALRDDASVVDRFIGNTKLEYNLPFFTELTAHMNVAYDYSKGEGTVFVPDYASWEYFGGGLQQQYGQEKKNELLDFYLNYVKELPAIQSRFDIMGGYSWQHFWQSGFNFRTNLPDNLAGEPFRIDEDFNYENEYYLISFFGRINYQLMDRYLFTFTLRNDGSSRFSPDNRWGLFPSAAFAWKINEEAFMSDQNLFSELKLRLGYGITGQQDIGGNYPYLARYDVSREGAYYFFGDQRIRTLRPAGYDANIKWEETTTYNAGIDYGIAQDRYYGSVDFYFRETRDLLNFIPVPAGTNLTNFINTNIGDMENTGVEFSIFTRPVITRDFSWLLGFNATWNKTEITRLTAVEDPDYLGVLTGGISGGVGNTVQVHTVGFAPNSFFVFQQVYDTDGNPIEGLYVDRNGDGVITDDDRYRYQKPASTYYLGLTSDLSYRNWGFSFAGRANLQNFVYNNISSMNGELSRLYRPEGPYLSNITPDALVVGFNNAQYLSDYYIQDASFFKMDNISLSYNFKDLLPSVGSLTMTATVQNAFVITGYEGLDPEVAGGIDNNIYPRPRNFVLNLNLQF